MPVCVCVTQKSGGNYKLQVTNYTEQEQQLAQKGETLQYNCQASGIESTNSYCDKVGESLKNM